MNGPGITDRRYWIVCAAMIVAGVALRAPAFGHDFAADDYAQLAMMEGVYPSERHPLSLFTFSNGQPDDVQRLVDAGFYPWFSHPELRLSMMRPLGSALMWVDYGLFGRWAMGYHLHSLLWWLLLLAAGAWAFRDLLGARYGLLATFFFVLDETHGVMMGWIANRNAIVAALLCLVALVRHVRARERGELTSLLALLLFTIALGVGEYTLCMLGYFFAYELIERREAVGRRVRALAPLLLLSFLFLGLRSLLGFGSYGSDLYIDPTRTPAAFVQAALSRFPVLLSDLVLAVTSDWWTFGIPPPFQLPAFGWEGERHADRLASWRSMQESIGWVGLLLALFATWIALKSLGGRAQDAPTLQRPAPRRLAWFAAGALLSVLPPMVTAPTGRSLVGPAWGLAAVLAAVLLSLPALVRARAWLRSGVVVLLLVVHLGVGPLLGWLQTVQMAQIANLVRHTALSARVDDSRLAQQRVLFLSMAEPITPIYFSLIRKLHDRASPRSAWLLCPTASEFVLSRPTPSRIEIFLPRETMLGDGFASIFRTTRESVPVGHRFTLDGMTATVLELRGGFPSRMRYDFEASLDDPRYVLLAATPAGLVPGRFPAVGSTVRIPAPRLPGTP